MAVDRRKLILDAAMQSFSHFGYKATTMDLVSKSANVGKGTIYTFFKTKEDLFREVVGMVILEMNLEAENAIKSDNTALENAHAILCRLLKFRKTHQLTAKLIMEAREIGTPAVLEAVDEFEEHLLQAISTKVERAVKMKEIRECDPNLTAFVIVKMYKALIFDWEEKHEPLAEGQIANYFKLYLFEGLSNA